MDNQIYTSEIHKLLKLGPDLSKPLEVKPADQLVVEPVVQYTPELSSVSSVNSNVPMDLPIADAWPPQFAQQDSGAAALSDIETIFRTPPPVFMPAAQAVPPKVVIQKPSGKSWSGLIVYPLVFLIAFGFFYSILNFNALWLQVQSWFAKDESEEILAEDLTEYNKWIGGYYFAVKDMEKLEPNNDLDLDGLTNLDEFTIKTNPTEDDSDNDGISDGIEAINGTNLWGNGQMTKKQKEMLGKLDLIKVNNRISLNSATNLAAVLGQHTNNFDTAQPGRLSIPKLHVQVPIIWTQDPAQFDTDLTRGTVHYPGTAMPGETGVVYISGHSSDYFWKNHPYKQVFARINALEPGDDIFVDVYGKDGKIYNYRYTVTAENIYAPDDQRQFIDNTGAKLNLSTCWPIGTQKDRYIVTAELQPL